MKTREELIKSPGYWTASIQLDLFREVNEYLKSNTQTQLAEELGVTKGYISQILNGNFDHRLSKFVELSIAVGKIPKIEFENIKEFIDNELAGVTFHKFKVLPRPQTEELEKVSNAEQDIHFIINPITKDFNQAV
jgi:transcriptional regulator with XRE-family HTH domain